jgi:hypothetical protein
LGKSARSEVGSAATLFRVKQHEREFVVRNGTAPATPPVSEPPIAVEAEEAAADRPVVLYRRRRIPIELAAGRL